jgi:hypothetical protein
MRYNSHWHSVYRHLSHYTPFTRCNCFHLVFSFLSYYLYRCCRTAYNGFSILSILAIIILFLLPSCSRSPKIYRYQFAELLVTMWLLAALDSIWYDVIKPENYPLSIVFVSEFLVFSSQLSQRQVS